MKVLPACLLFLGLIALCSQLAVANPTAAERNAILTAHNNARARMPAAPGSMKVLKWDTNLEAVAQAWADGCPENHNGNRGSQYDARGGFTSSVGENMGWAGVYPLGSPYPDPSAAMQGWYDEEAMWTYPNTCVIPPGSLLTSCGHWTQVIWANSEYIGCGIKRNCSRFGGSFAETMVVCNYATAGNVIGQAPYPLPAPTPSPIPAPAPKAPVPAPKAPTIPAPTTPSSPAPTTSSTPAPIVVSTPAPVSNQTSPESSASTQAMHALVVALCLIAFALM